MLPPSGGGGQIHPAYTSLNYVAEIREMVAAEPSLFQTPGGLQRKAAKIVVAAMMASERKATSPQNPRVLGAEGEVGGQESSPSARQAAQVQPR